MDVKILLLMNIVIVANCQSTISNRDDATNECELSLDIKSEMESIRQLLMNQQQEKTDFERLLRIIIEQQPRIDAQAIEGMKSKIDVIQQIVIQQQYWNRNEQRKAECPVGFDFLPEVGRCFTFVFEAMSWDNATKRCRGIMPGVHLAAITSQEENDAVVSYLQLQYSKHGIGSAHGVWVSGQRRNPGRCDNPFVWKTLNGIEIALNYTNWVTGEPNCDKNHDNEPCVYISPRLNHAWNDNWCMEPYYPLCEI